MLTAIGKDMQPNKQLIVLVGLPGSGKSTMCGLYEDYTRISQDDMGKEGHMTAFNEALERGDNIIIDRCNFNIPQRSRYLKPAKDKGYRTLIIWLQVSAFDCKKRIRNRENHPNLDKNSDAIDKVVDMFNNMFEAPERWEADEVLYI